MESCGFFSVVEEVFSSTASVEEIQDFCIHNFYI